MQINMHSTTRRSCAACAFIEGNVFISCADQAALHAADFTRRQQWLSDIAMLGRATSGLRSALFHTIWGAGTSFYCSYSKDIHSMEQTQKWALHSLLQVDRPLEH